MKATHNAATPQWHSAKRTATLYMKSPMSTIAGTIVMGPTNLMIRPTNPVSPIRMCMDAPSIRLPESCKCKKGIELQLRIKFHAN